jgi:hypothetical protein
MLAVLKGLHSTDIADVETYLPNEADNFGFVLRAMVGPMDGEGEESFDITVCTPRWLLEKYGTSDVLLGRSAWTVQVDRLQIRLPSAAIR